MGDLISTNFIPSDAVIVGVITQKQTPEMVEEYLDELQFLAETYGVKTKKRFTQKLDTPNTATFVGKGRLEDIRSYIKENEIGTVIFDDDLSPSQLRNIEKILDAHIFDRSLLILEIFNQRAQTSHARTQVELARYQYLLPRLTNMWTHLERQRGGTSTRGGAGEKEIETDKRIIRDKIARLKKQLKAIDKQMATQRGNRGKLVRVALVGYTNVGKSTLMNLLSKSKVFAEDKLFATLDTTVRKVVLQNIPFLMADTVGFIRKLPHQLVESFKSTLDEVREADLIVHVVDIAHPAFEDHYNTVNQTLAEIEATNKPTLLVFNKVDTYDLLGGFEDGEFSRPTLKELKKTWMAKLDNQCVFISAQEKINIDELRKVMYEEVKKIHITRFPYNDFLYQQYE